MLDLITLVGDRLQEVMAGKLFDKPGGGQAQLSVIHLGVQSKQEDEQPFVVVRLLSGADNFNHSTIAVELVGSLYVSPDRDIDGQTDADATLVGNATTDMESLVVGYRTLFSECNYSPYSLESMKWWVGDKRDGLQPGPDYYEVSAELVFQQAPIA